MDYTSPKHRVIRKKYRDYNWQNEGVWSDEGQNTYLDDGYYSYTTTEIERFIYILTINKATKTGPVDHGNIALLLEDGDIADSGYHPDDFGLPEILDGGVFNDLGELEEE